MKRYVQLSLLTLTLAAGVAVANSGPEFGDKRQQRVEKLSESLGIEEAAAQSIVDRIQASKEQRKVLREQAKGEVEALRAAVESGDEAGMAAAMDNMDSVREELRAIKAQTREDIFSELTVEQRAKVTGHFCALLYSEFTKNILSGLGLDRA